MKRDKASEFIWDGDFGLTWIWVIGYTCSILFVIASSAPVVYYHRSAGGSGIPELIGFLNGAVVQHIFNLRTIVVKCFSCVCAIDAGLSISPEGPMIHVGYVFQWMFAHV